jgi:hypothetical protein
MILGYAALCVIWLTLAAVAIATVIGAARRRRQP